MRGKCGTGPGLTHDCLNQVKHLEVSSASMAEDLCRKSTIIETYVMDSRIGEDPGIWAGSVGHYGAIGGTMGRKQGVPQAWVGKLHPAPPLPLISPGSYCRGRLGLGTQPASTLIGAALAPSLDGRPGLAAGLGGQGLCW